MINNKLKNHDDLEKLNKMFDRQSLCRLEKELIWIKHYEDLLAELAEINQVVKSVGKNIKHNGLSKTTLKFCDKELQNLKSKNGKFFEKLLSTRLHEQNLKLPKVEKKLMSSDILESTFGKYKNRLSDNQMASVTSLMLIISAFTINLTLEKIKVKMEKVKISYIKEWEDKYVGNTLFKKRNLLFSSNNKKQNEVFTYQ